MPNRVIKETIRTSKSVNSLTDFQFRLWLYLITYVDDYGRGSADPEILKGLVFTRRKGVTEKQIEDGITGLANAGMINLYEVDGESYLYFPNWGAHQRIQTKKEKFPAPPSITESHGDSRKVTVSHGESPYVTESHGESRPESNPNTNTESEYESEYEDIGAFALTLKDGSVYCVKSSEVAEYQRLYPSVDVEQELRNMVGWCNANTGKRKTSNGIGRFINAWLCREQERSGQKTIVKGGNPFLQMLEDGGYADDDC